MFSQSNPMLAMDKDIKQKIESCIVCKVYRPRKQKHPLLSYPVLMAPWHIMGINLFLHSGYPYTVTVDNYSFVYELQPLQSITARAAVKSCLATFAANGLPKLKVADDGLPLNAGDFKEFLQNRGTSHVTTSPYYPQLRQQFREQRNSQVSVVIRPTTTAKSY